MIPHMDSLHGPTRVQYRCAYGIGASGEIEIFGGTHVIQAHGLLDDSIQVWQLVEVVQLQLPGTGLRWGGQETQRVQLSGDPGFNLRVLADGKQRPGHRVPARAQPPSSLAGLKDCSWAALNDYTA
jgi:hypothetical protein